jgi:hypothetical protein
MDKKLNLLFLFVFCIIIPKCFTDLTGLHYLHTTNCSAPLLYIPQGPYLFSHHWPFLSITVYYQKSSTIGACYPDGSLVFMLNNDKICSGMYHDGQAKLFCQFQSGEYCFVDMETSDGSRLTCK